MLGGIMALSGKWADGSAMLAVPNYARMNRIGGPDEIGTGDVDFAPGTTQAALAEVGPRRHFKGLQSQVWVKNQA
jgi:hypothetical protein